MAIVNARAAAPDAVEAVTHAGERVVPSRFDGDVRNLPPPAKAVRQKPYRPLLRPPPQPKSPLPGASAPEAPQLTGPLAPMPAPNQNFPGLNFNDSCAGGRCGGGWPPDPNGDVGPNHYIQAVNTAYAIWSKSGTLLASFTEDQLWSASSDSNPCKGNSQGDPIVVYDALADRWILSHFAFAVDINDNPVAPFFQCIAVSQSSDPVVGGWYFYPLQMDPGGAGKPPAGTLNDYSKFGIWTDCLYMTANGFNGNAFVGAAFASLSRSDLYSGAPLTWSLGFINNGTDPFTMIPSNLTGKAALAVPAGTPNYLVSESQTAFFFEVRKFTAGPNCGPGGTLSGAINVSQATYHVPDESTANIAQPNTTNKLDNMGDRLMQKVQYRKVGAVESLWVVHNVQTSTPSTVRPQWAQLDVTGQVIATTPVQQQIYGPDTTLNRWMGSVAADAQGNMALGYSTSNGSVPNFPSIAYSGRLAGDPLNTLPQTETQLVAGGGSQTNDCGGAPCDRWGDYSAMSVDPSDDCTFWYTTEYYSSQANGTNGNWQTRIGSFKFPGCMTTASAPTVTTGVASGITSVGATLNGTVSSNGATTTVTFQYGLTTGYGSTVTAAQSPLAAGASGTAVSAATTGLNCNTTYHFRAVGANSAGATNGSDASFATSACPNANLANLALSAGTLSPSFASGTTSYSANVVSNSNTITVTPTVSDSNATVTVNGVSVASGNASGPITLATGSNLITIVVTAQDGVTTKTYTVNVNYLPLSSCTYALAPLDLSNTVSAGGIFNVTVTTPDGCPVGATSFQPWVVVNGVTPNGNGTTTVQLQISANAGTARATSIRIADRLFLVTQGGP